MTFLTTAPDQQLTDDELANALALHDDDGDGALSFEEFVRLICDGGVTSMFFSEEERLAMLVTLPALLEKQEMQPARLPDPAVLPSPEQCAAEAEAAAQPSEEAVAQAREELRKLRAAFNEALSRQPA